MVGPKGRGSTESRPLAAHASPSCRRAPAGAREGGTARADRGRFRGYRPEKIPMRHGAYGAGRGTRFEAVYEPCAHGCADRMFSISFLPPAAAPTASADPPAAPGRTPSGLRAAAHGAAPVTHVHPQTSSLRARRGRHVLGIGRSGPRRIFPHHAHDGRPRRVSRAPARPAQESGRGWRARCVTVDAGQASRLGKATAAGRARIPGSPLGHPYGCRGCAERHRIHTPPW